MFDDDSEKMAQIYRLKDLFGLSRTITNYTIGDWVDTCGGYSDNEVEQAVTNLRLNWKGDDFKKPKIFDFERALREVKAKTAPKQAVAKNKKTTDEFIKECQDWWHRQNPKIQQNSEAVYVANAYIYALVLTQVRRAEFNLPFSVFMILNVFEKNEVESIKKQGRAICLGNLRNGFMDAESRKSEFVAAPFEIANYNIVVPENILRCLDLSDSAPVERVDIFEEEFLGRF